MRKLAFLYYEGMTALDVIGAYEGLSRLPDTETVTVAKRRGPIRTDSGAMFCSTASFAEIQACDILFVPGASSATSMIEDHETLSWVRRMHEGSTWTVSVCTGSLILGAAGLLSGVRATTHWSVYDRLKDFGASVVEARVVLDGKFMTGGGVSSGIDLSIAVAEKVAGPRFAQALQLAIEYDPQPPFNTGHPRSAPADLVKAVAANMSNFFVEAEAVAASARYWSELQAARPTPGCSDLG